MAWPTTPDGIALHPIYVNGALGYDTGDFLYADAITNGGLIEGVDWVAYTP